MAHTKHHRVSTDRAANSTEFYFNPAHEHPWSTYTSIADETYRRVSFQGERVFYTLILDFHGQSKTASRFCILKQLLTPPTQLKMNPSKI